MVLRRQARKVLQPDTGSSSASSSPKAPEPFGKSQSDRPESVGDSMTGGQSTGDKGTLTQPKVLVKTLAPVRKLTGLDPLTWGDTVSSGSPNSLSEGNGSSQSQSPDGRDRSTEGCQVMQTPGLLWSLICAKIQLSYDDQTFWSSVFNDCQHVALSVVLSFQR